MGLVYQTSHVALAHRAELRAGETLLVHAAAGGVGLAAVQIGLALGARVIGTAGTEEKLALVKENGADFVLNYRDADWVESVAHALDASGLSAGCLELEITETSIIQDEPKTLSALSGLSQMGVGIVLDDFGTGFSSLSHLRRLPISRVKIDRSFVSEISDDGQGAQLTAAIVELAHSLDLSVVAEGVETHEQAKFLRANGCDEFQGYLISRALSAPEFERFLDKQKAQ